MSSRRSKKARRSWKGHDESASKEKSAEDTEGESML